MLRVQIQVDDIEALASRLDSFAGSAGLGLIAVGAVNAVTTRADAALRAAENAGIHLSDAYVKSKTDVRFATSKPQAEIATRGDLTIMGRYPIAHLWQPAGPARQNRRRGTVRGGPSKGDAKRGIPSGYKQAGLRVDIKKGSPTAQEKWFTMTLRSGAQPGANVGVFVRDKGGPARHLYAVSPYSLFRFQAGAQQGDIQDDLTQEMTDRALELLERTI